MRSRLERLYARRRELDAERSQISKMIARIEKRSRYVADKKIHHASVICGLRGRYPPTKRTRDWALVDCLRCLNRRERNRRPAAKVRDWKDLMR